MVHVTSAPARLLSVLLSVALALPAMLTLGILTAAPAAAADPMIQITKAGPAQVLVGDTATYDLTATNPPGADQVTQYNLSFRDVLPPGVVYVGPTTPSSAGDPTIYTNRLDPGDPATEYQTLVWSNVADLQINSSADISFVVRADADPLPVASDFANQADAYTNSDPRYVPKFDPTTGVVVPGPTSYTASATTTTSSTGVTAFTIDKKSTPNPEGELQRGVHDHVATYTLAVTNNPSHATNDIEIRDYLPAGLEFLGCGAVDSSTDTALYPNGLEYPSAPSLADTPAVASCNVPLSVETVTDPAPDAGRTFPPGVYTKVTWQLGDLTTSQVQEISYRAGIPQRANTAGWQGAAAPPVAGSGGAQPPQTANLDNNTGPSTRETTTEQSLKNVAVGDGLYTGPVKDQTGPGPFAVQSSTDHTVTAEDLALQKSVAPGTFDAGQLATYTLELQTSEYVTASGIVITDVLPNGVCPVWSTQTPTVTGTLPADCGTGGTPSGADPTGATLDSVTRNADGTFTLGFEPLTAGPNVTPTITYQARMRTVYTGGPLADLPTSSGDTYTNHVSLTGTTDILTDIDVNAPAPSGPEGVQDSSSATQSSTQPVIDKRIKPNVSGVDGYRCEQGTGVYVPGTAVTTAGAAEYVDPSTAAPPLTPDQIAFRKGSDACFLLRVEFPSQSQTRNPVVTDFVPTGTSYVTGSAVITDNSTLTGGDVAFSLDSAGNPVWAVGVPEAGNRFAPKSSVFEVVIAVSIDEAAEGDTPDIVGNLMKFRSENSAGQAISLRDALVFGIAPLPPVSLVKGISQITPAVPPGSPAQDVNVPPADPTDVDGRTVRDGDVVQFRIDVANTSDTLGPDFESSVRTLEVWDKLPSAVPCAQVGNAQPVDNPPAVTVTCLDPSDAGYPASLAGTDRSLLTWQFDISDGEAIPAGGSTTLAYDFTVPDEVSVATVLTDDAGVRSYQAYTNLTDVAATYYPIENIDPSVPVADRDAPKADDPSNVVVANVALTKTGTTSITEDNNSTSNEATIGEVATYALTAAVPYGTSVYQGVLTDRLPTGLEYVSAAAEYSTDGGSTWSPTLPAGTLLANSGRDVTLTLPPSYTAAADATQDHVFRVVISARVTTTSSNAQDRRRNNVVSFQSKASTALDAPDVTAPPNRSYRITIVEPAPALVKVADKTEVGAGETVAYTLTASNAVGRPPLHDSWVIDCVPEGLTFGDYVPASRSDVRPPEPGTGANGCRVGQTRLAWSPTSPNPPAPAPPLASGTLLAGPANEATLEYTAVVSSTSAGLESYVNNATLTGGSLADGGTGPQTPPNPLERVYSVPASESITVRGAGTSKQATPAAATIGETATWTIRVVYPANVNFYRAAIIDDVRQGIDMSSISTSSVECVTAAGDPPCSVGSGPLTPAPGPVAGSTLIGWYLGDLPAVPHVREVVVTYTGRVADIPANSRGDDLLDHASGNWFTSPTADVPTSADTVFDRQTNLATATVVVEEPSVAIDKAVAPNATPAPGDDFTYTVTARNLADADVSDAFGVVVSDAIPVGVVVALPTISDSGVFSPLPAPADPALGGGTIEWPAIASLAPGVSRAFTYGATLAPSASLTAAAKVNTATVVGYNTLPADAGRPYTGPSTTESVTPALPMVTPTKGTPNGPIAYVGTPFTWQVTLENTGSSRAYKVDAVDTLPLNWEYTATSSVIVAGTAVAPVPEPTLGNSGLGNQTLTWTDLGDIAPGQSIVVTFTATPQSAALVDPGVGSSVAHTNTVAATAEDATGAPGSAAGPYNDLPAAADARIDSADLVLDKDHVGTPVAGQNFDWTIAVTNEGPDTAVGPFTVTDTIEAPMTLVSATGPGWDCSAAGADVTCTRSNAADVLASSDSFPPIAVRVAIPSDTAPPTTLSNTAAVSAATHDPVPANNTDTDTAELTAEADLAITKARTGPLEAGRPVTYTLDVSNLGPSTSRGPITVTDAVPTSTTFVSAAGTGWACPADGAPVATITCTRASDLLAGQAAPQITVVLALASSFTGDLTNTGEVSGTTPDPVDPNNTSSATGTVTTLADVAIEKTHGGDFTPGTGTNSYTFTVTNFGPADAAAPVAVVDELPAHLSWTGSKVDVTGAWTCVASPAAAPTAPDRQTVTCTLTGGLSLGQTREVRIGIAVAVGAPASGSFVNTATVSSATTDPVPANNESTDRTDFDSVADLAIEKTPASQQVVAGQDATFTLSVSNVGPSNSAGPTVVTDVLPAGMTLVSAQGTGWDTCTQVDQTVTCSHPDGVAAGGGLPGITVVATVAPSAGPATLVNGAGVDGPTPDPDPRNNTDEAQVVVVDEADLAIVKTFTGSDPVPAGASTTFGLAVQNTGPSDADSLIVGDVLPAGLMLVEASGEGWTCTQAGQVMSCARPSLAAGAFAPVITLTVEVDSGFGTGTIENTATVTSATTDPTPGNNTSTDEFDVGVSADLVLVKSHDSAAAPVAGEEFTFDIAVRNAGPSDAQPDIVVTDSLPVGLSYVSNGSAWTCTTSGTPAVDEVVECTLDGSQALVAGAAAPVLTLTTLIGADTDPGEVINTAEVSSATPDPKPGNNSDNDTIEVTTLADLVVTKSHTGPVAIGSDLEFTLGVSNAGPSEARSVTMVDTLPAGLTYVSAVGTDWTCVAAGQDVTCDLAGPLAPLATAAPITLLVEVDPAAHPEVENVVVGSTSTPEEITENNTAKDPVTVPALVDLAIDKAHTGSFTVGSNGSFTLTVTNDGPTSDPGPQRVTDVLPVGLGFVSAGGDGWICAAVDQAVTCTRSAELAVGASAAIELTVAVRAGAAPSVSNTSQVSTPSVETDTQNNIDTDVVAVTPVSILTIVKDVIDIDDDVVTYAIVVGNTGPNATSAPIVVVDPLPAGLEFISAGGDGWACTEGQNVTCTYSASIPVDGSAGFELTARLIAEPGTDVVNVASVVGPGGAVVSDDADVVVPESPAGGGSSGSGSSTGNLPETGADLGIVVLAFLLLGTGWVAVRLSRRAG